MTEVRTTQHYLDVWGVFPPPFMSDSQEYLDVWCALTPLVVGPTPERATAVAARGGAVYLDSFLEYDGRHVGTPDGLNPGVVVTLSGGTTWGPEETLTLSPSDPAFSSDDVGNVFVLHGDETVGGALVRFTITGFAAGLLTGTPNITVPVSMRDAEIVQWDKAVDVVAGLEHLEGKDVGILADNHVVASPGNTTILVIRTVDGGSVDLGDFYTHVYVGLPYFSDLETLDIEKPSGSSVKGSKMAVTRVGLMVMQSRSLWVGGQPPTDDTIAPLDCAQWNNNGRVFVRSVDPTPATILAALPNGFLPPNQ